ncbi:hypothetical protein F4804DRAFT_332368 [Jackrogersella minutella]|nr:hypothetical protein F4804DRAFT_332368 [Jackrogersella minutella]
MSSPYCKELAELDSLFKDKPIQQIISVLDVDTHQQLIHLMSQILVRQAIEVHNGIYVLFNSIMKQMKFRTRQDMREFGPIATLLSLAVNEVFFLPSRDLHRFTRLDLVNGLTGIYNSPGVSPHKPQPLEFNFHFHHLAASLYQLGSVGEPIFFICAMRDALEEFWADHNNTVRTLRAVHMWLTQYGQQLFRQYASHDWDSPALVRHGYLYQTELE